MLASSLGLSFRSKPRVEVLTSLPNRLACLWTAVYVKGSLLLTVIACLVVAIELKFRKTAVRTRPKQITLLSLKRSTSLKAAHRSSQERDVTPSIANYSSWQTSWQVNQSTSLCTMSQTCPSWTPKTPSQPLSGTTSFVETSTMTAKQTMNSALMPRRCSGQRLTRLSQSSCKTNAMEPPRLTSRTWTWRRDSRECPLINPAQSEEHVHLVY